MPALQAALEAAGLPDGAHLSYSDNYFHLMPGREAAVAIGCRTPARVAGRCRPGLRLFGWNCPGNEIEVDLDLGRRV